MNYKILITAENQAIVKRIADENGMNEANLDFTYLGSHYIIENGVFPERCLGSNCQELTLEEFKEKYMKQESELHKWLRETKAMNFTLDALQNYLRQNTCPRHTWDLLEGYDSSIKGKILFNQWNPPFNPKRGDKVMVWDGYEGEAQERIFLTTIEGSLYPIITVHGSDNDRFNNGEQFAFGNFKHMKPMPTEFEVTMDEIANKFGVDINILKIKK